MNKWRRTWWWRCDRKRNRVTRTNCIPRSHGKSVACIW